MTLSPGTSRAGIALIAESSLAAPAATIDFPGIPATYRHLHLVLYGRTDEAAVTQEQVQLRMNGDSGANYAWQKNEGFDSSVNGLAQVADTGLRVGELPGATALANAFGLIVVEVPYYATTLAFKSAVSHAQNARAGTAGTLQQGLFGGYWLSTAAITQLTLRLENSPNFVTGSIASLYGIT